MSGEAWLFDASQELLQVLREDLVDDLTFGLTRGPERGMGENHGAGKARAVPDGSP